MIVPGTAVRRRGLFAAHQLAEQVEEGEAQRPRWRASFSVVRAQHLQLDRFRTRAHPRRYRRPMARAGPRGQPAGYGPRFASSLRVLARAISPAAGPRLMSLSGHASATAAPRRVARTLSLST